ncbi:COPII coat assembly protein SEC16 [Verticillium alfalfae VaMs.102]|uniref:Protein transport protein sec16 n=1 Tax=Verticillium alfalfae (strain VaMs.102 / ATCC MYA-4576 / FGSC 10136) TaxID=526221 RepID=C9S8T0_VERA1|nr:COPII coat assembly protein SEC16 [Verticillium alfalfae VaMs.102]EEY14007.1 COPII coat assembly protein SEC16 [Verticillium alfalfae VaMs.102]
MSSDEHVSSWHPALMPNSSASATVDGHPSAPAHIQPPPVQDSLEGSEPYAHHTTTSSADSPAQPEATADLDASLINEPTELTSTSEATMPPVPDPIPQDESAIPTAWFAEEPPPEVQAAGPVLGHSSTVSFARTVSHDINFHDDEDADWNLSRTDTDPFKFMPPSDRTNSFPVVPPASPPGASAGTQPLPATEAQHVIQATEQHQDDLDAPLSERAISPAHPHFADDPSDTPHINGYSEQARYVGRDMTDADEDDVGSRFEEGLPLIPRAPEHTETAASASFFDHEASADDDFFSHVQDAGHDDTPPTLERKSTMQVLGAFGTNPLSRADTLEGMAEEDEHQATPSQALATEDDSSKPAPEDLAAKWQEAFAGDDDDEFLLDDNAGDSKPVDPAAFFGSDDEGFLDDDDDDETTASAPAVQPPSLPAAQQQSLQGRYTPQSPSFPFPKAAATPSPYVPVAAAPPQTPTSAYAPSPVVTSFPAPTSYAAQSQPSPIQAAYGMPPPPRPEASKAQSFADKNKGGYTSPYDLPMDVKPRKRASMQQLPRAQHGQHGQQDRRISAQFEPRVNRVSSLPPTQEVEEDEGAKAEQSPQPVDAYAPLGATPASPPLARHTPPPSAHGYGPSMLSPPKRAAANYTPQPQSNPLSPEQRFAPPMRSQTQSPGSLQSRYQPSEAAARPASSHGAAAPQAAQPASAQHSYAAAPRTGRHRAPSQSLNMVAPTDGRENDPLKRWKGAPVFSWGIGGTIITSFPKEIPRYGMGQTAPMIVRTPGEVRVKQVKDIEPLEDRLAKFPGPLKGKSKKKETISWLTAGIESLEANLPGQTYSSQITHEDKRTTERVLLWKILRTFIEFDGALEGGAEVEAAVRDILSPEAKDEAAEAAPLYADGAAGVAFPATSTQMQADGVDSQTVVSIRKHLLAGDREQAVWAAVDKRLWGHAMLISNTVSPDLYKQVAQEFVRKEVNYPGRNNESIAALYKVLSGNFDECVDELVPSHARAGRQLMTTAATAEPAKDALDGLDKWRETLGLVLSNRSPDDTKALSALGDLLSTYGRAEAAHICFLFARKTIVFGGLDDQTASFVLLGADHKTQAEQFGKETEALLLSEVFEYGLSLANGANSAGVPHLAAYKLQHAATLAEHGFRDKALQYCDVIANSITAQTKRSPYHHALLEAAVDDLSKRLKQAPKGESSSWISKPSMNKVSDSMWNRFNKFVAGDEADGSGTATPGEPGAETGPFGRIAGGTPTISPSPSVSNFDVYGNNNPGYPVTAPAALAQGTRAASRYAPMGAQPSTPTTSYEPTSGYTPAAQSTQPSNDYGRASFDAPTRTSIDSQSGVTAGSYTPQAYNPAPYGAPLDGHAPQPDPAPSAYGPYGGLQEAPVITHQGSPAPPADAPTQFTPQGDQGYQPPSYGYEPSSFVTNAGPDSQQAEPEDAAASGGYEAPSYQPYSYEPPTYDPGVEPSNDDNDDDDKPKPKKKSFMDDDEDDIPALRPQGKSKSEKDKENDEMFRKAAEEDGKIQPRHAPFLCHNEANSSTAKRAGEQSAGKKGWGFGSWWGGKKDAMPDSNPGNKPIRAKLGESSSFVYDPESESDGVKKAGAEQTRPGRADTLPPSTAQGQVDRTPPLVVVGRHGTPWRTPSAAYADRRRQPVKGSFAGEP